ncbi:hypothetical protein COV82_03090 [Candidatus Peregrinibacteria bacterium CG11_big_fil_rev_8_21_14_0_20_46_8]|nr:MAG: hypothetical protein COV82_03090 [Candidatus Peregrinibacteria bacterium CG11_big_fil_rev_8_21_14_0_20_46_8]
MKNFVRESFWHRDNVNLLADEYGLDPIQKFEDLNHILGGQALRWVGEMRILTRREIAKVQVLLSEEWNKMYIECNGAPTLDDAAYVQDRVDEISVKIALLNWHADRIRRLSGLRKNLDAPRRPHHFQNWLRRKIGVRSDRLRLSVPHPIAQHSPCGCNPVSEHWQQSYWGDNLELMEAQSFIVECSRDGIWYHQLCGQSVAA